MVAPAHILLLAWHFLFFSPPVRHLSLLWDVFKFLYWGRLFRLTWQMDIISCPHPLRCVFHCGHLSSFEGFLENSSLSPYYVESTCTINAGYLGGNNCFRRQLYLLAAQCYFCVLNGKISVERDKLWMCITPCFYHAAAAHRPLFCLLHNHLSAQSVWTKDFMLNKQEQNSPLIDHVSLPMDKFACDFPPVFPSFFLCCKKWSTK